MYVLSEQDVDKIKGLLRRIEAGTISPRKFKGVKESYLVHTHDEIDALAVQDEAYIPGVGTGNMVALVDDELEDEHGEVVIHNIGKSPVAANSYVTAIRNPLDGNLYVSANPVPFQVEFIDNLFEGDTEPAEAWLIDADGQRSENKIDVYADVLRGVIFGRTAEVDKGDKALVYYDDIQERYYALSGAMQFHAYFHDAEGTVYTATVDKGAGEDPRQIVIECYMPYNTGNNKPAEGAYVHIAWNSFSLHFDVIFIPFYKECYFQQDVDDGNKVTLILGGLAGDGLEVQELEGCNKLAVDCDYVQDCIDFDIQGECPIDVQFTAGNEETPDTWTVSLEVADESALSVDNEEGCEGLKVNVSDCHLLINESNELALDVESLAGPGLQVSAQECDRLAVQATCNLEIDENNNVVINRTNLCGEFLVPDPEDDCAITLDMEAICEWLQENCPLGGGSMGMNALVADQIGSQLVEVTEQAAFGFGSEFEIEPMFEGECCNFIGNPTNAFSRSWTPDDPFSFQTPWQNAENIEGDSVDFATCDIFQAAGDPSYSQELVGEDFDWLLPEEGTIQSAILRVVARGESGNIEPYPYIEIDGTVTDPDFYENVNTWPASGFAFSEMRAFYNNLAIPIVDADTLRAVLRFDNQHNTQAQTVDVQYVEIELCLSIGEV